MNDLIPIQNVRIGGETVSSVSARELHEFLEVAKDFPTWVKAQLKRAKLIEHKDYEVFPLLVENPKGGRPGKEVALTISAAKHISMMSGTSQGHAAREYFIECERRASMPAPAIKDPKIAALVEVLVRQDAIEQEQARQSLEMARLQEDLAVVEARTQPENKHFTVMGYANLVGVSVDIKAASALGKRCASLSRERGLMIGDVTDPRFGKVHTYHESVLEVVMQEAA